MRVRQDVMYPQDEGMPRGGQSEQRHLEKAVGIQHHTTVEASAELDLELRVNLGVRLVRGNQIDSFELIWGRRQELLPRCCAVCRDDPGP